MSTALHPRNESENLDVTKSQPRDSRPTVGERRRRVGRLRRTAVALTAGAVALAGLGVDVAAPAGAADAGATTSNVVTRWIEQSMSAVRTGSPAIHTGTPGAGRTYAMTAVAMYDAVNGIDLASGNSTRSSAIVASYAGAPAGARREAAASSAAHAVLRSLFSTNATVVAAVDSALHDELAALGSDQAVEQGRAWGSSVGAQVVQLRAGDGSQEPDTLPGGQGPGVNPRPFTGAQFRNSQPFGVAATEPFASAGPPALTTAEYAQAFNEVKALGSATDTDPERAAIARHWLAEARTVRETGLWFKATLDVVARQGTVHSVSDTSRLFALLGMAIADSVTVSWSDKYVRRFWRPGDAIRQADADGNPETVADPNWSPRNGVCSSADLTVCTSFGGSPEYTSGTSAFAGAAAAVLGGFYCTDAVPFTFKGEQLGSAPRSYAGFAEAAREAGRSRIYGGIHFQFSNDHGRAAGKEIGREIIRTRLTPDGVASGRPTCAE